MTPRGSIVYFHIVGEVNNAGDLWLRFIKITETLRDADGGVVDVIYTYTQLQ